MQAGRADRTLRTERDVRLSESAREQLISILGFQVEKNTPLADMPYAIMKTIGHFPADLIAAGACRVTDVCPDFMRIAPGG